MKVENVVLHGLICRDLTNVFDWEICQHFLLPCKGHGKSELT